MRRSKPHPLLLGRCGLGVPRARNHEPEPQVLEPLPPGLGPHTDPEPVPDEGRHLGAAPQAAVGRLALERGAFRDTVPDFSTAFVQDELRYAVRNAIFEALRKYFARWCRPIIPCSLT